MNVTVSLGGSVVSENIEELDFIVDQIRDIAERCEKVVVVVGAGSLKKYIGYCDQKCTNSELDSVGIRATRLNASVLRSYFDGACGFIPSSFRELNKALESSDLIFMGGTEPGHSTDGVSAIAAETIGADVMVDATDVDGVLLEEDSEESADVMTYSEVFEHIFSSSSDPGSYSLIDRTAKNVLERSDIDCVVVNGNKRDEILRAVFGGHSGTLLTTEG